MRQKSAAILGGGMAAAALVVIAIVSSATHGVACAASFSAPVLTVVLAGDPSAVTAVEICTSDSCSFAAGPTASPPQPTAESGPSAPGTSAPAFLRQSNFHTWGIAVQSEEPPRARVLVRGADGAVVIEKSFTLHWKQDGPTTACGTTQTTPPLHLLLPAA